MRDAESHARHIRLILEEIAEEANHSPNGWDPDSNADWTQTIKQRIYNLGAKNGFATFAGGVDRMDRDPSWHGGEWLYDLCWLDYGSKDLSSDEQWFRSIPLVLESEWSPNDGDIYDDFQKLLQARANLRVMILVANDEEHAKLRLEKLIRPAIERFARSQRYDYYLIAIFDQKSKLFRFWEIRPGYEWNISEFPE